MKSIARLKYTIIGIVIGSILSGGFIFAANNEYILSLFDAKLVFNGVEKKGSDKPYQFYNGKSYVPTSLIYQGSTYVPLAFFAQSSGLPVKYVGKEKTIYIGKVPEDNRIETPMSDILEPFYKEGDSLDFRINKGMTMAGKEYTKGYQLYRYGYTGDGHVMASFNLEGKYKSIDAKLGLDDDRNKHDATLMIYADDKMINTIQLKAGSLPQDLNIDVTGVIRLDFKLAKEDEYEYSIVDLADITIK